MPFILLVSCAQPARYRIVSEETKDIHVGDPDQRYVFLNKEDAAKNREILALHTKAEVQAYAQRRKESQNPIEDVLYHLVREEYQKAGELLNQYGERIPEYLRLVIKADLASQQEKSEVPVSQLVKMYQDAFEVQTHDLSREIIKLRIRQIRYGR